MKNGPSSDRVDPAGAAPSISTSARHELASIHATGGLSRPNPDSAEGGRGAATTVLVPRAHPKPSWRWRVTWFLGWCVALLLALVALARIFFHDATLLLTCINAFSLYAYLPAYIVLAWSIWQRRWLLATLCALIVLCHIAWVAPDFALASSNDAFGSYDSSSPTIKIFCANVRADNEERDRLINEIIQVDADVVVLVEYRRWWHSSIVAPPISTIYRYGTGITEPYLGEIAVYSKYPIRSIQRSWPTGRQVCVATLEVGNQTLELICIHSPRPMNTPGNHYFEYWDQVLPMLADPQGPRIVLGDFNATQHSKIHAQITDGRLRSAHIDRGRGWAVTWPNAMAPAPPIRIDHAFLSPEVECLQIAEGEGGGSDHKPLILEVRVHEK